MRNSRIVAIASCILALALGSTSCKKDKDGHTPGELMTIGATIVQANGDGTKTFLAPNGGKADVRWSAGDKIMLFGAGDPNGEEFTLSEGAGSSSAKFTGHAPSPLPPYYAAYPEPASFSGGSTFTFTIPATIAGEADLSASSSNYSFIQKSTIPMVGVSAHGEDLKFYNAMSSIFLALKGTDLVSRIVLEDLSGTSLSGTLTVKQDDNTHGIDFTQTSIAGGGNTLTLNANVQLEESKYSLFCFPVPKGAFAGSGNVSIKVYNGQGSVIAYYTETISGGVGENTAYALVTTIKSTTLTASTTSFSGSTKTSLNPSGSGVDVKWSEGDAIKLFGNSGTEGQIFTLQSGANSTTGTFQVDAPEGEPPYYAAYPADKCTGFNSNTKEFTFKVNEEISASSYNALMVGYSADGKNMTFKNAMSVIKLQLKGIAKISKIVITDTGGNKLNGTLTVKLNEDGTISSTMGSNGTNKLTISLGDGMMLDARNFTMLCFPVPTGAFNGTDKLKIEIYDFEHNLDNSEHLSMTITKSFTGGVAQNTAYAVVEREVLPLVLPGVFSIVSGYSVRFTRGNLWYDGTDCHFEENQWTYPTSWNTAHVGHFYNHNIITNAAQKSTPSYGSYYAFYIFPNSGEKKVNENFTVEGLTGECRVISSSEYQNLRDRSSSSKYGYGRVNGVNGLIFLPDSWTNPLPSHTFASGSSTSYTDNEYDLDDWVIMESAGAVFFPLAGYRSGTTMNAGKSYYTLIPHTCNRLRGIKS